MPDDPNDVPVEGVHTLDKILPFLLADVVLYTEASVDAVVAAMDGPVEDLVGTLDEVRARAGEGYLVLPTRASWTAVLRRSAGPEDLRPLAGYLPVATGGRTVLAYAVVETPTFGFVLADPQHAGLLNAVRVRLADEGEVQTWGEPLPVEVGLDPGPLDLNGLDQILRSFGIDAFRESFYLPPGSTARWAAAWPTPTGTAGGR